MTRKRILHVITGLEVGGAETNLAKVLPVLQKNFDNHVCCLMGRGPMRKKFADRNIPIFFWISSPFLTFSIRW